MKKRYVAGFLFDKVGELVALIEKQRPDWQKFQLNGIGGKIEKQRRNCMCYDNACDQTNFDPCICPWETPEEAMRREFREETGVDIDTWQEYAELTGPTFEVYFFHAYSVKIFDVETKTDEVVKVHAISDVLDTSYRYPIIENLRWLIPMALTMLREPKIMKFIVHQKEYEYV
jgi:8-oxo-dGTP pyrophosphatase MutT (NUDIX family)